MPDCIQLHIAQPCPAEWQAMTPTGDGRHCATCQKTVVDFTTCTDAEVLAYFRQARPGQTCGRFQPAQLSRPLTGEPRRRVAWLAGLLLVALAAPGCQSAPPAPQPAPAAPAPLLTLSDSVRVVGDSAVVVPDSLVLDESATVTGMVLDTPD